MRRAIVTGASRGIGRAIAEMLLDEGWQVLGVSRTRPDWQRDNFIPVQWDISDPLAGPPSWMLGPQIDALIHCAAIRGEYAPLEDAAPVRWEHTVQTNLFGTYRTVWRTLPYLHRSEDGRILLFSGGGAFDPSPGYSAYAVSKAGVVSLMETLAAEMADTRVTVNCVAPGFVATSIHDGTPDAERVEREGAMDDVLGCVRHLLSPATRGLTGRTVAAQYDDWPHLNQMTIGPLMQTPMGARSRHTIEQCQRLVRRAI